MKQTKPSCIEMGTVRAIVVLQSPIATLGRAVQSDLRCDLTITRAELLANAKAKSGFPGARGHSAEHMLCPGILVVLRRLVPSLW